MVPGSPEDLKIPVCNPSGVASPTSDFSGIGTPVNKNGFITPVITSSPKEQENPLSRD